MAFAPLDIWARLLLSPRAWVPPRYWLRLGANLFTSAIGTVATLPERLVLAPILRARAGRSGMRLDHAPGVVIVLGYFRSGTTHLHYLLSCDPRFRTPRWCETLAPQGFWLSWAFLRAFLIPFVSAKRPQDDVAIGPEWPAEDDFALSNGALASSLPGRFVLPRMHAHYDRFHDLERLSERERRRWRFAQWAFCWKLSRLARDRAILLKTPSHTARVRELVDLFGADRVRFIHISRDPAAVVKSNVSMAGRLALYHLQDPDPSDDLEGRIVREYVETERKYLAEAMELAPGSLTQVRYEDLIADPIGELRRTYAELGLQWTEEFERRALTYLDSVRDYKPATRPGADRAARAVAPELLDLASRFGHDRPSRPKVPLPEVEQPPRREKAAIIAAAAVALACAVVWIGQAFVLRDRHDGLVWPVGFLIGLTAIRTARVGSVRLGICAAALTVAMFVAVALPATFLAEYYPKGERYWEWYHISLSTRRGLTARNNLFWLFMGAVTAYRIASREHVRPPGT
jgi:hypothetical protein